MDYRIQLIPHPPFARMALTWHPRGGDRAKIEIIKLMRLFEKIIFLGDQMQKKLF